MDKRRKLLKIIEKAEKKFAKKAAKMRRNPIQKSTGEGLAGCVRFRGTIRLAGTYIFIKRHGSTCKLQSNRSASPPPNDAYASGERL
jgi:hypothetical protein